MYIAFKWLVSLTFTMWLAMCVVDMFLKENMKIRNAGVYSKLDEKYRNKSIKIELKSFTNFEESVDHHHSYHDKEKTLAGLHFIMFLAGALAVTAFHNKQIIIVFVHRKIYSMNVRSTLKKILNLLKKTAKKSMVTLSKYLLDLWRNIKNVLYESYNKVIISKISNTTKHNKIHTILLRRLRDMEEERKNLGKLLISSIHENKNIRLRYELETMTKNRLKQHIEDTQKQIKEHRTRYVSFQQLYLVTHQENIYLKARLGKLKQEKDEAEKNLMGLINEVYRSRNNQLKAYCSKFIVKSKDKILNSDVKAEIQEFLENSRMSSETTLSSKNSRAKTIPDSWSSNSSFRITEIINENDSLVPLVAEEPKLRGLPGEYVWTVKDKDGIIQKLYEYDFESDLDNGDTVRRIRQYSVYYDKDCLLDFSRVEHEAMTGTAGRLSRTIMLDQCMSKQNIVTGSEAFQKFLQSKPHSNATASPLLYA